MLDSLFSKIKKPTISDNEYLALLNNESKMERGFFTGKIQWNKLFNDSLIGSLSTEEESFIRRETRELCELLDSWQISMDGDLPTEVWDLLQQKKFFGLVIPKVYGGLGFSALAHHRIVTLIASVNLTAAITVMVPNSLGPAELILMHGTEEQQDTYLPKLASGELIPCFALTNPKAGSDAASIPDTGIEFDDYFEVTLDKRYITLAPIANLFGIAFQTNKGITFAIIERDTKGLEVGKRHWPARQSFMNGPVKGTIKVYKHQIIGGADNIGKGWQMLMDALAKGRAISLPSLAVSGLCTAAVDSHAYAKVRKQFKRPIEDFEGIQEPLANILSDALLMTAAEVVTMWRLDKNIESPVVASIMKYQTTERMRKGINAAMDIAGGKGICDGPKNHLFSTYMSIPMAITVEGANILTRSLLTFGQGATTCHPHIAMELLAMKNNDSKLFFSEILSHVMYSANMKIQTFFHSITNGFFIKSPMHHFGTGLRQINTSFERRKMYYKWTRLINLNTYRFAFISDLVLWWYRGKIKSKQLISGRLADVLSELYLTTALLSFDCHILMNLLDRKSLSLIQYTLSKSNHTLQQSLFDVIRNLPWYMRWPLTLMVFPWGVANKPSDKLMKKAARCKIPMVISDNVFISNDPDNIRRKLLDAVVFGKDEDIDEVIAVDEFDKIPPT